MSDNDDELPCFKLIFDYDNVRKTSSSISESMSEFQSNTKGNNNKSLKTMPVCIVPLEESYIEDFAKRQKAFNTERGTNTAVRRLMTWHIQRYGKPLNLSTVTKQTANSILKHFFLEVRDTRKGKEGEEYEPGTLTTYRNGLRRYFLERPKSEGERFDIGEDEDLKNKLSSKRKQLKSVGKGNRPNACDPLDEEQIEKLWSSGAIGLETPRQLLNLVWWNNIRMLGMRAMKEHLDCKLGDFVDKGSHFTFGERSTKTRNGEAETPAKRRKYSNKIFRLDGGKKDPYRPLKEFISHRPEGIDNFYLQATDSPKNNVWYKKLPLKKEGISSIMKNMVKIAGIENEGHFAPSTGRKTAIQSLRSKFDPVTISELTGHADPASVLQYSHNPMNIQRQLCGQLAGIRYQSASKTTIEQLPESGSQQGEKQNQVSSTGAIFQSSVLNGCTINVQYCGH